MGMRRLLPFGRRDVAGAGPFTAMRRETERMMEGVTRGTGLARPAFGPLAPRVDVEGTEAGVEVTAELPGVAERDVELELKDGVLTLRGEKRQSREAGGKSKGFHLMERSCGAFMRRIPLPVDVDEAKVTARFEKGVLHVSRPRSPQGRGARPRGRGRGRLTRRSPDTPAP
jgi:HSP20 family protein